MASDAAAPNVSNAIRFEENGCIAPGGLAAARPGKGQGYFRTSFIRLTSLSRGFGSTGGPPERSLLSSSQTSIHFLEFDAFE
jgi:hypothetical protein